MTPTEAQSYDLYLSSLNGDVAVFEGRSLWRAGLFASIAALCAALYAADLLGPAAGEFGESAHLSLGLGGLAGAVAAALFWGRRERLVLRRDGSGAVYKLNRRGRRIRWQAPLQAFSSVTAELEARSDGKKIGPRYWAFYLNRWDGARVRFAASGYAGLSADRKQEAARLVRALAEFLECEGRVAEQGRIAGPAGQCVA